jgi:hypothetical protein
MQNDAPAIVFSCWVSWADRSSLEGCQYPGVYLLAHFDVMPSKPADPQAQQIVYIGETCDRRLIDRWRNFHRSASTGKHAHSGGRTYRELFSDSASKLCVAALPIPVEQLTEPFRSLFIRYVERKLIWEYAWKWGSAPFCNRK